MPQLTTYDDIVNAQPRPGGQPPVWWKRLREWIPVLMFVGWLLGQFFTGTGWFFQRTTAEENVARDVIEIRRELNGIPAIYVRQDVFGAVLQRIDQHLASIDGKLSDAADARKRQ